MFIKETMLNTVAQLKTGELTGVKHLTLSEELIEFPMDILTLADSLEVLDLSNNQLSSLPKEIAQLTQLKILFASNNCFSILPEALGLCPELEMVGFKANQIAEVPEGALPKKLRWLILTDNCITQLPESLGERFRLEKLALAGNQLITLPKSFGQLHNLALLRISANQLAVFPTQLLTLPKLAWLAFSGNPFCESNLPIKSVPEVSSSNYALEEVLGQGASGVIYKANWNTHQPLNLDCASDEDIAVKVFKGEVTSDGYPKDELQACLKVGHHHNLVKPIAQVKGDDCLALIMELIPSRFKNLGQPPSFNSCTRDIFKVEFSLSVVSIQLIVEQMREVFEYIHMQQVCHGDLYAHNTLFDEHARIIFGDFGAASMYHMLPVHIQRGIKAIEQRALNFFIDDLLSVCRLEDKGSALYQKLRAQITSQ